MKNKIIVICLALAFALSLCGCQLAHPEGDGATNDRLIGCFITTEHIDLFDFEGYFNDNANKLVSGGTIGIDGDTAAYQGKLYAEYYEETLHHEDGTEFTVGGYRFPDLEGIAYFAPTIYEEDGHQYVTFESGEGVNDVDNRVISHNDEDYCVELSATVYAPVDADDEFTGNEIIFYLNPVYQTAEGSIYLISGQGMAMNSTSAGMIMAQTLSEEYTTTVNGEKKTAGSSVEITYETAYVPRLLRVIEMDGAGMVLGVSELDPEKLPDTYTPRDGCAYMISESVSYAHDGSEIVTRGVIEPDGEERGLSVLTVGESGWMVSNYCEVEWEE